MGLLKTSKIGLSLSVVVAVVGCSAGQSAQSTIRYGADELVFSAKITSIQISPLGPGSTKNHIVTTSVQKIIHGTFAGDTFQFRISSPTKSGLRVGEIYTIVAEKTKNGLNVDQYQWDGK